MSQSPSSDESPHRTAIAIAALYGANFAAAGVHMAFFPVWLEGRGLSTENIGLVLSLFMLARALSSPIVSAALPHFLPLRAGLFLLAFLSMVVSVSLHGATQLGSIMVLALLLAMVWNALFPLSDALAMHNVNRLHLDYGRLRLTGSATFIVATIIAGWFLDQMGYVAALYALNGLFFALVIVTWRLPTSVFSGVPTPQAPGAALKAVIKNKAVMSLMFGYWWLNASHAMLYSFATLYWQSKGATATEAAILWGIGVGVEIGVLAFSRRLLTRWGARMLLLAGGVAALIRWSLMGFDLPLVIQGGLQALHGCTFATAQIGVIALMTERSPPSTHNATHGINYLGMGLVLALTTAVSGTVYRMYVAGGFWLMVVPALVGFIVLWRVTKEAP